MIHENSCIRGTVLIVDDDENNLQLSAKTLHSDGFQVLLARDGVSALEICDSVHPDAIILDIMMPGMDGFEVCRKIREKDGFADIPIIFLSAAGEEEMIEQGLGVGGVDFISKPVSNRILLARLRFHIEKGILQKTIYQKNEDLDRSNKLLLENEKQLKLAIKKLQLLSGITRHDILNKVTSLNAYITLIGDEVSGDDTLSYVNRAKDNVETIRELIMFARDYQDIGIQSPKWHNMQSLLIQVTRTLNVQSFVITIDLDTIECYADPLLEKVFYNLFENSIRHGKNLTHIWTSYEMKGDDLVIRYEDNGGGIPESEKENIFIRKYYKNSGLGLFISRDILNITGYTIIESGVEGTGVRFEIKIPKGYFRNENPEKQ